LWSCITDNNSISTYGLTASERDTSASPMLLWDMAHLTFNNSIQILFVYTTSNWLLCYKDYLPSVKLTVMQRVTCYVSSASTFSSPIIPLFCG